MKLISLFNFKMFKFQAIYKQILFTVTIYTNNENKHQTIAIFKWLYRRISGCFWIFYWLDQHQLTEHKIAFKKYILPNKTEKKNYFTIKVYNQ